MSIDLAKIMSATIESRILLIRGQRVILDADLAELYDVETKALNQAVRRNEDRFPSDFRFRLTEQERKEVVTICDHLENLKFSPSLPHAFTEHGAIMAACVLNSPSAVQASVYVVRVFIKLRRLLTENRELAEKMHRIEQKLENHSQVIRSMSLTLREPTEPTLPRKRGRIGL